MLAKSEVSIKSLQFPTVPGGGGAMALSCMGFIGIMCGPKSYGFVTAFCRGFGQK